MASKTERFQIFVERLLAAPVVTSHDEAFALITTILNAVEDEHSGVPANPAHWQSDGRMYPPQADMARTSKDLPGITIYRNRAHRTLIAANGAFRITEVGSNKIVLEKSGHDGRAVPWNDDDPENA